MRGKKLRSIRIRSYNNKITFMLIRAIGMTLHAVVQIRKGYNWKVCFLPHISYWIQTSIHFVNEVIRVAERYYRC